MFKMPLPILEIEISEAVALFCWPSYVFFIDCRKAELPKELVYCCLFNSSSLHRPWLVLEPDGKTKTGISFGVQKEAGLAKALSFLSAARVKSIFVVNHQKRLLPPTAPHAVFVSMKAPSTPQMTPCRQEMCFNILQQWAEQIFMAGTQSNMEFSAELLFDQILWIPMPFISRN